MGVGRFHSPLELQNRDSASVFLSTTSTTSTKRFFCRILQFVDCHRNSQSWVVVCVCVCVRDYHRDLLTIGRRWRTSCATGFWEWSPGRCRAMGDRETTRDAAETPAGWDRYLRRTSWDHWRCPPAEPSTHETCHCDRRSFEQRHNNHSRIQSCTHMIIDLKPGRNQARAELWHLFIYLLFITMYRITTSNAWNEIQAHKGLTEVQK